MQSLIREKEKCVIFDDRPTDRAAVFIQVERSWQRFVRVGIKFEPGRRIQESIAIELKGRAVELVGAVLDRGVDDRA